jgi:hypothetical protein
MQEFAWTTAINIATQYLVYLPLIIIVENKHFGEVTLVRLLLPGLAQGVVGTIAQIVLLARKVWPELRHMREQSLIAGGAPVRHLLPGGQGDDDIISKPNQLGVRTSKGLYVPTEEANVLTSPVNGEL